SLSFLDSHGDHQHLHSFPTRRSSDLAYERLNCYNRRNKAGPLATGLSALDEGRAAGARPRMVRMRGLEPPRLAAPEPKSGASTRDRKSTRLNSSHVKISYAVFCLKKK